MARTVKKSTPAECMRTAAAAFLVALIASCSPKAGFIRKNTPAASISLNGTFETEHRDTTSGRDSIVVRNVDGHTMLVMKSVKDENGEMVASQTIEAATITARFRNVAERHGKVDICFLITVPQELMEGKWQLRYSPTMFISGDSTKLDMVKITGKDYRKKQLRGYQHYERFIRSIITDSTHFIRKDALEIFLQRNIPQLYAFRSDTCFVSEGDFLSSFGVSKEEAVKHYTDRIAVLINEKKKKMIGKKRDLFIKVPIESEGVRLDSVIVKENGDWTYQYVQTVAVRPAMRKIEVVLDGAIYEQEEEVCRMLRSAPLSFYVSSLSSLVDDTPRYVTRIIERKAEASMSYDIAFRSGKWTLDESLGNNAAVMEEIRANCLSLLDDETFELDSICVCAGASPEGESGANRQLSSRRSVELSREIRRTIKSARNEDEASFTISWNNPLAATERKRAPVKTLASFRGEDWDTLDRLVEQDTEFDGRQKEEYFSASMICPEDARENAMKKYGWYAYVKDVLYPQLRRVSFNFHMHRRAMVKDTVHTTTLDTNYMHGVECIRNRDYAKAIEILRPYNDYNTAVAYCAKDYNHSAMAILSGMKKTAPVNYMLALLHSRTGDEAKAVELYMKCCSQDSKFIFRGNLDPEISYLIKKYNINSNN